MSKARIVIDDDTPQHTLKSAYVICCTPRSGSYLLAFTLEQQGLGIPREYFNPSNRELNRYLSHHLGQDIEHRPHYLKEGTLFDQLQDIVQQQRCSQNGIFGTKLFGGDMGYNPERMQRFQNRMTVPTKYIVLRRSDLVAKAISVHFAMENNQWFEERGKTLDNEQVQYDYAKIKRYLTAMKVAHDFWDAYFPEEGNNVLIVNYSDLATDFRNTIKRINTFLGFEGLDIPAPPIQKQTHPLKESFRKLFLTEYKAELKQQRSKK